MTMLKYTFGGLKLIKRKHSNDWVGEKWEQHCSAALASLDFFGSVFYQEKIERSAGEAKDELKENLLNLFTRKRKSEKQFYKNYM